MDLSRGPLRPDNPRVTCPPGPLQPGTSPLIMVASLQRSGTHLLIDAILNNFPAYKRRPLYVDLDRYLSDGLPVDHLLRCKGYIVKTHFPQIGQQYEAQVREVADAAIVLTPSRAPDKVYSSSVRFGATMSQAEFARQREAFSAFWSQYQPLTLPFSMLVNSEHYEDLLAKIGQHIGMAPNKNPIRPFAKNQRVLVYVTKAITRLVGCHSPVVNTTISFAK